MKENKRIKSYSKFLYSNESKIYYNHNLINP